MGLERARQFVGASSMTVGRLAAAVGMPRPWMLAVVAVFAVTAFVSARPAGVEARSECDPGLSACQQLQADEQQQSAAQQQLNQIEASQASAQQQAQEIAGVVAQAQAAVEAQENAIAQTQAEIIATERSERYTQAAIDRDQANLQVREQLVDEQVRSDAETDQTTYLQVLLTAQNFSEFVNRAMLVDKLIQANQNLVDQVQAERAVVQQQQAKLQKQQAEQTTLLNQQVQEEVVLEAQLATQQQALAKQQALVQQIAAQGAQQQQVVNNLQQQINTDQANYQAQVYQQEQEQAAAAARARQAALAAAVVPAAAAVASSGGGGGGGDLTQNTSGADAYPAGQCTYYVATIYNIPGDWGNADTWFPSAAGQGYATSSTPSAGAVVVWGSGGGYSEFGHVAVVQSVQSSTSFTVTEMNFYGVGIVDSRQVTSLSDVEGFIL
jgi:peptidoglycan DL-endopeptidase CwlO